MEGEGKGRGCICKILVEKEFVKSSFVHLHPFPASGKKVALLLVTPPLHVLPAWPFRYRVFPPTGYKVPRLLPVYSRPNSPHFPTLTGAESSWLPRGQPPLSQRASSPRLSWSSRHLRGPRPPLPLLAPQASIPRLVQRHLRGGRPLGPAAASLPAAAGLKPNCSLPRPSPPSKEATG